MQPRGAGIRAPGARPSSRPPDRRQRPRETTSTGPSALSAGPRAWTMTTSSTGGLLLAPGRRSGACAPRSPPGSGPRATVQLHPPRPRRRLVAGRPRVRGDRHPGVTRSRRGQLSPARRPGARPSRMGWRVRHQKSRGLHGLNGGVTQRSTPRALRAGARAATYSRTSSSRSRLAWTRTGSTSA